MMNLIEGPRGCKKEEFKEAIELLNLVFYTLRGKPNRKLQDEYYIYNEKNLENMRVLKVDKKVVAHTIICERILISNGIRFKVGGIGGVCTHPDYRGKGYASLILKDCIRKMEKEDYDFSILWTGNPDFYRCLGWEQVGIQYSFFLNKGNFFLLPSSSETIEISEKIGCFSEIKRIHEREPLRLERTLKEYSLLFSLPGSRAFLARRKRGIVAYLLINQEGVVLEYGGEAEIVAFLLKTIIEKNIFSSIAVITPPLQEGLPKLLLELGFLNCKGYLGMVRLINKEKIQEKIGKKNRIDDSLKSVKILFGPEKIDDVFAPIPLYWWRSEHV